MTKSIEDSHSTPASTVQNLYRSISFGIDGAPDYAAFRTNFVESGLVTVPDIQAKPGYTVMSVDRFIEFAEQQFCPQSERTNGFREVETEQTLSTFGRIAHVISSYECFTDTDAKRFVGGVNGFQLSLDAGRWRILSLFWDRHKGSQRYSHELATAKHESQLTPNS